MYNITVEQGECAEDETGQCSRILHQWKGQALTDIEVNWLNTDGWMMDDYAWMKTRQMDGMESWNECDYYTRETTLNLNEPDNILFYYLNVINIFYHFQISYNIHYNIVIFLKFIRGYTPLHVRWTVLKKFRYFFKNWVLSSMFSDSFYPNCIHDRWNV